jgi:hypothetical protein
LTSNSAFEFSNKHQLGSVSGFATNVKVTVSNLELQPVQSQPDKDTGVTYENALTIDECQNLFATDDLASFNENVGVAPPTGVLPPLRKGALQGPDFNGTDESQDPPVPYETRFGFKPVTLEPDFAQNRVRIQLGLGVAMDVAAQQASTFLKVLGIMGSLSRHVNTLCSCHVPYL